MDDISGFKTDEHIGYITLPDGDYKGVSYKINEAKFIEKDGKDYIKLDYNVKDLPEGQELEFEQYMGELVVKVLEYAVKDKENQV